LVGITTNYAVQVFIRSDERTHGVVGSYTESVTEYIYKRVTE